MNNYTYKQLDRKASAIVTKLRHKVATSGYYENLGQNELRDFKDLVSLSNLTYPEQYQLTSMLSATIDNI